MPGKPLVGNRQYEQERALVNDADALVWADKEEAELLQQVQDEMRPAVKGMEPTEPKNELVDALMGQLIDAIAKAGGMNTVNRDEELEPTELDREAMEAEKTAADLKAVEEVHGLASGAEELDRQMESDLEQAEREVSGEEKR